MENGRGKGVYLTGGAGRVRGLRGTASRNRQAASSKEGKASASANHSNLGPSYAMQLQGCIARAQKQPATSARATRHRSRFWVWAATAYPRMQEGAELM